MAAKTDKKTVGDPTFHCANKVAGVACNTVFTVADGKPVKCPSCLTQYAVRIR